MFKHQDFQMFVYSSNKNVYFLPTNFLGRCSETQFKESEQ